MPLNIEYLTWNLVTFKTWNLVDISQTQIQTDSTEPNPITKLMQKNFKVKMTFFCDILTISVISNHFSVTF